MVAKNLWQPARSRENRDKHPVAEKGKRDAAGERKQKSEQ
jgi:hypothetical protein